MIGIIDLVRKDLTIEFEYREDLVNVVRQSFPVKRFDKEKRVWVIPKSYGRLVKKFFEENPEFHLTDEAKKCVMMSRENDIHLEPNLEFGAKKPYQHQIDGVKILVKNNRMILGDEMGLGKTLQSLVAAKAYSNAGFRAVVLSPASLEDNWMIEAADVGIEVSVYSWNNIPNEDDVGGKFILVADEAHYAQSGGRSKRGSEFLALAKSDLCVACYCLTGTPMKNGRPINLFPLLVAVRHPLGEQKEFYERRYCDAKKTRFSRWDTNGSKNLDELHDMIKDVLLIRYKKDCLDLPEKMRSKVFIKLSAKARTWYNEKMKELKGVYEQRLASGEIQEGGEAVVMLNNVRQSASIAKCEYAIEKAKEILDQGESVVIFTYYQASAKILAAQLDGILLTGDTPQKDRQGLVEAFQSGKKKVFVYTMAGGVGITLVKSHYGIAVDRPMTPGDAVQIEDRIHRIGQGSPVTWYWLQCNVVDQAIDELIESKQDNIDLVLKGKRKTISRGMSQRTLALELLELAYEV